MAMMGAEVEVALLHQMIADTAHDHGVVAVCEFGNQNAHSEGALLSKRAGQ